MVAGFSRLSLILVGAGFSRLNDDMIRPILRYGEDVLHQPANPALTEEEKRWLLQSLIERLTGIIDMSPAMISRRSRGCWLLLLAFTRRRC